MKNIVILGSTGSIGRQALEVIESHPEKFKLIAISARSNTDLLIEQAIKFQPQYVVLTNGNTEIVKQRLKDFPIKILEGSQHLNTIVSLPEVDIVLTAIVGFSGLIPTLKAIEEGKDIALANKETLVVAGEIVMQKAREHKVKILPVDSEHSAIFQSLMGEDYNSIEKIYLTASGGPFRGMTRDQLKNITKNQALKHPNWSMGNKITIDSATLMNKGLEAIEAKWIFDLSPEQIDIVIHPQSIIHSMVQFVDGSIKAQMGLPDMRLPIQFALTYPKRLDNSFPRFDFKKYPQLTFEQPDIEVFKCLDIALEAMRKGGNYPCAMNAANEVVVEAFLQDKIGFLDIPDIIEQALNRIEFISTPNIEQYLDCDIHTRIITENLISKKI